MSQDQEAKSRLGPENEKGRAVPKSFWSNFNLFPEFDNQTLIENPYGVIQIWRDRALKILVLIGLVANLPLIFAAVSINFQVIPRWSALTVLFTCVTLMMLSAWERIPYRKRFFLFMIARLSIGLIQFATTQLFGSGRIALITISIAALVLGGEAYAGLLAIIGFLLQALVAGLIYSGSGLVALDPQTVTGSYFVFQIFVWLGQLIPHLYLMMSFLKLQRKTLDAISAAHGKIEKKVEENRRLEFEMNRVGEEERRKLGAELHDGLCQHLAATLLNFSALEYQLKNSNFKDLDFFENIKEKVEKSIDMAYEVSRGLYPLQSKFYDIFPALQEVCRETRRQSRIECRFVSEEEVKIEDREKASQLYRIAGESINNAVKHSKCSQIMVRLFENGEEIILETEDDGKGFDRDLQISEGRGLSIMEYRASLIGGKLEIEKSESGGTLVRCRIPRTHKRQLHG